MYIFLNFISNNSFIGHNMLFYVKKHLVWFTISVTLRKTTVPKRVG